MIARISKGTRMDQVYLPKNRVPGFEVGRAVLIKPVEEAELIKPYFYDAENIEPIKNLIIESIINTLHYVDNLIITGSFLNKGFDFNDIDIIILDKKAYDLDKIRSNLESNIGVKFHILQLDAKTLLQGLNSDPLFQAMLSKFVSMKRVVFNIKRQINYKLLDLHLLKSKAFIDGFDYLRGNEKYILLRNMIAIDLFLKDKKISLENIDSELAKLFKINIKDIKENMLPKRAVTIFRKKYAELFGKIMKGIKDGAKQE